jgi:hypothetical protein
MTPCITQRHIANLAYMNTSAHAVLALSDFRLVSPFSYWAPVHYGNILGLLELALMVAASPVVQRNVNRAGKFAPSIET